MNKWVIVTAWVLLLTGPAATIAKDSPRRLGIITGNEKSTAYRIGMDLRALAKRDNVHLSVFDSNGSVENVYAVYQRPGNHLGLVQSDVLAFVAKVEVNPRLKLIANKIKWVFPLYDQEIHILGKQSLNGFGDLRGKRVAVGHVESGAYLTSRLLFEIAGVVPGQVMAIGNGPALAALKAGSIDAMVIVDGIPVQRLAVDISPADGLHLISIAHEGIRSFYPASRIPAGTYAWQKADVDTVSVKAVLVAYDFRNHYCTTIGNLAWLMSQGMDWLQFNGHPKWKSVDLNESVEGWDVYNCVKAFDPAARVRHSDPSPSRKPNPVADAIEAVFRP